MPLLQVTHPFPNARFGLWQITENEDFFRADMPLSEIEAFELSLHHNPLRRLEWLAGRWLLHKLSNAPRRLALVKDAFSKPFFPENQHLVCSLSHSKGTVGALLMDVELQQHPPSIGCDIQVLTPKMPALARKFMNDEETALVRSHPQDTHLDFLHLLWTAKESLYKAYGLKALDFRENIFVEITQWDGYNGAGTGMVKKGDFALSCRLVFQKITQANGLELLCAAGREVPYE